MTYIATHVEDAQSRLITQYRGKVRIEGVIEATVQEFQTIEDVLLDLYQYRSIDTAFGAQLDGIGKIVKRGRNPEQEDESYRIALKSKIVENISQGEPERLISVFQILTSATVIQFGDFVHGEVGIMSEIELTEDEVNDYIEVLKRIVTAAVRVDYIGWFDADDAFALGGNLVAGAGGLGTVTDANVGGKLAQLRVYTRKKFGLAGSDPTAGGLGTVKDPLVGGCLVGI